MTSKIILLHDEANQDEINAEIENMESKGYGFIDLVEIRHNIALQFEMGENE